jgi:lytic cellulose monooxygenase (C1-hydroxylating)
MQQALFFLTALASLTAVSAHGHVEKFIVASKTIQGFNPSQTYAPTPISVPGWTAERLDNGFVGTDGLSSSDIICHKNAKPGKATITIPAGETITMVWDGKFFPSSSVILFYHLHIADY